MELKSFEIKSYKSCIRTKMQIHPNLTALIGINGAGKSNIMTGFLLTKKIFKTLNQTHRKDYPNKCSLSITVSHKNKSLTLNAKAKYETDDRNNDRIYYTNLFWDLRSFFPNLPKDLEIPAELFELDRDWRKIHPRYVEYIFMRRNSIEWSTIKPHIRTVLSICKELIAIISSITYL